MNIFILLLVLCCSFTVQAQYKTVNFNYERSYFNEGQPLPAQNQMMVNGEVSSEVQMVQLKIFRTSNTDKTPLHTALWKRPDNNLQNTFTLPVNYKLNGGSDYTFLVFPISSSQYHENITRRILSEYADQNIEYLKNWILL